ncbi:GyrI-like domain-containing protein [Paenibacillus sp. 481]|uniref:GyrI-like domain-containing protein n=1 Tax=Paenibacillus sp. 481 TaxID=2835869 RepID=UPI001E49AB4B|nr:GyrI-like domain-containing protein [Paenibacillus sp. 481]UHA72634.1 GyrI-like domain-containing protein [Paenibacillus sp. 481]
MEPVVLSVPQFTVIGITAHANLKQLDEDRTIEDAFNNLQSRVNEIRHRAGEPFYLIQIYPCKENFDPNLDAFTSIIGVKVAEVDHIPSGMISHLVPESKVVKYTHVGLESELSKSYSYLYGTWMQENGQRPADFDFEIWDHRYKPSETDNEIDLHIALA